jgi:hypothetical protein
LIVSSARIPSRAHVPGAPSPYVTEGASYILPGTCDLAPSTRI